MSVTDWKMQEEWKGELVGGDARRIQKPYYNELDSNKPLTPIATLKELKSKQYDEALQKIDFHIKANFLKEDKVRIYQGLLPENIKINDNNLHAKIKEQGYQVKNVYGLASEVVHLEISGW